MRIPLSFPRALLSGILLSALLSWGAWSAEQDDKAIIATVLGDDIGSETGIWRTKIQHVFDATTRTLDAKRYTAFDPNPSRNLDFVWLPDDASAVRDGVISGKGQLIWRTRGVPTYDPSSPFSVYIGDLRDGRPQGRGRYVNRGGLTYDGTWSKGRFDGNGILRLPNGEEYHGKFAGGLASGRGRYIDITGESFEGRFVRGVREGSGQTTLPGGMTYESRWNKGTEVEGSLRIRVAQLGNQPSGVASSDFIRLGATIEKKPMPNGLQSGEILGYSGRVVGDHLRVEPDDSQLVSVWMDRGVIGRNVQALLNNGSEYRPSLFGFDKAIIYPPLFSFDLQNRSAARIGITGFYLDVKRSQSEKHPAIDLSEGSARSDCGGQGTDGIKGNFAPFFTLLNYGWSSVEQATLRYSLRPAKEGTSATAFENSTDVKTFDKMTTIDVSSAVAKAGGSIDRLRRMGKDGIQCKLKDNIDGASDPAQCLASIKGTGAFGTLADMLELRGSEVLIGLRGTLEYKYRNGKGELVSDVSPLTADLSVAGLEQQPECGEGGRPEIIRKDPVALKLDQANYRIQLPLQTTPLDAGQSRRYSLALNAAQASSHEFQLVATLSDGREIRSRPIDLLYFIPKWHPNSNF